MRYVVWGFATIGAIFSLLGLALVIMSFRTTSVTGTNAVMAGSGIRTGADPEIIFHSGPGTGFLQQDFFETACLHLSDKVEFDSYWMREPSTDASLKAVREQSGDQEALASCFGRPVSGNDAGVYASVTSYYRINDRIGAATLYLYDPETQRLYFASYTF